MEEKSGEVLKTRSSTRHVFEEHDGLEAEGQEDAEEGDPRPFGVAAVHQLVERQEVGDHVDCWQYAVEDDVEQRFTFANRPFQFGMFVEESLFLVIWSSGRARARVATPRTSKRARTRHFFRLSVEVIVGVCVRCSLSVQL